MTIDRELYTLKYLILLERIRENMVENDRERLYGVD